MPRPGCGFVLRARVADGEDDPYVPRPRGSPLFTLEITNG